MKELTFVKEDKLWYVSLPDYPGYKEDLLMVAGADDLLEFINQVFLGGTDSVTCKVWDNPTEYLEGRKEFLDEDGGEYYTFDFHLVKDHSGANSGAYYNMERNWTSYNNHHIHCSEIPTRLPSQIWLCDVVKYVYDGVFPDNLYVIV